MSEFTGNLVLQAKLQELMNDCIRHHDNTQNDNILTVIGHLVLAERILKQMGNNSNAAKGIGREFIPWQKEDLNDAT